MINISLFTNISHLYKIFFYKYFLHVSILSYSKFQKISYIRTMLYPYTSPCPIIHCECHILFLLLFNVINYIYNNVNLNYSRPRRIVPGNRSFDLVVARRLTQSQLVQHFQEWNIIACAFEQIEALYLTYGFFYHILLYTG